MRPPAVEGPLVSELALILAVLGALLVVGALVTAQRPPCPLPDRAGFLDRWQALHGGHDPRGTRWLAGWLAVTYRIARPLGALGVRPHALTVASLWLAAVAALVAAPGGRWALAAAALMLACGLVDALDGGVAALTGRATRIGYVADSLADRVTELAFLAVVAGLGGPAWLAVGCAALFLFHDYLRARAIGAGAGEVVVVTVGERAVRVLVLAGTVAAAGAAPAAAGPAATVGLAVMAGLALAGLAQLGYGVARELAAADAADADAAR